FFFSSRRRHTRFSRDWSSDVCSSDLEEKQIHAAFLFLGQSLHAAFECRKLLFLFARLVIRMHGEGKFHKFIDGNLVSVFPGAQLDRKSTRLNSSHVKISYAVFCLKKK